MYFFPFTQNNIDASTMKLQSFIFGGLLNNGTPKSSQFSVRFSIIINYSFISSYWGTPISGNPAPRTHCELPRRRRTREPTTPGQPTCGQSYPKAMEAKRQRRYNVVYIYQHISTYFNMYNILYTYYNILCRIFT